MFPTLKIKISGLEDDVEYSVGLEIRSVDCKRYRYVYQRWDVSNGFYMAKVKISLTTKYALLVEIVTFGPLISG